MHLLVTLLILSQGAQSMVKDAYENLLPPGAIARFGTQRFRAGFPVNSLAVNHDGKTLACTNRKGTLFLFNAVTGEAKHVIRQDFLDHVAFSPNGKLLVCSGRVGIRLLEPGSGAIMREIAVEEKGMDTACLSPNGEMIAAEFSPGTAGRDDVLILINVRTGKRLQRIAVKDGESVAFSPDGRFVATGGWEGTLQLWEVETGRRVVEFGGHSDWIRSVAFSPDGKTLASCGSDKRICFWDVKLGQERLRIVKHQKPVLRVAYSPDGKTLASSSEDSTIRLWDTETGKELLSLASDKEAEIAFSPDGSTLYSGDGRGIIQSWNMKTGAKLLSFPGEYSAGSIGFIGNDVVIIDKGLEDGVEFWNVYTGGQERSWKGSQFDRPSQFTLTQHGNVMAFLSRGDLQLCDLGTGKRILKFRHCEDGTDSYAFSHDGKLVATVGKDEMIRVWDVGENKHIRSFDRKPGSSMSLVISGDGKVLTTLREYGDDWVNEWFHFELEQRDMMTGKSLLTRDVGEPIKGGFSPHGNLLVSSEAKDHVIVLSQVATGKLLQKFKGHAGMVWCFDFSPDEKLMASGASDDTVRIWDVKTGKQLVCMKGHVGPVHSVVFSRDGKKLASGSDDTTVLVWDVVKLLQKSR